MLLFFLIGTSDFLLESHLKTPSGLIERFASRMDERDFSVKLTQNDGRIEWLEQPAQKLFSSEEHTTREMLANSDEAVILENFDERTLLGISPRRFEFSGDEANENCEAIARIDFPTPLSKPVDILFSKLKCDKKIAKTETTNLKVLGKDDVSWVNCDSNQSCLWNYDFLTERRSSTQVSAFSFLWTAQKSLEFHHLNLEMKPLLAKSWYASADKSSYRANQRTLYFGAGNYLDAFDGFVVVHEWGHAVIDDLNPGFLGYEARVLHEAVADFIASDVFDSPCFAPYDAQEIPGRKCTRNLAQKKKYPDDMNGEDFHADSVLLSGALWEARNILPSGLGLEVTLETLIRLPKKPGLKEFWRKFMDSYRRILAERQILIDRQNELVDIAHEHGF